ncbi:thiamine-monophosphate kinase, partial [bacterium]|nr:thiamine-monophosphate kinase [bacterium]
MEIPYLGFTNQCESTPNIWMAIRIIHRSMSREKDIITRIANQLPRSDKQLNNLFESDSEIIQLDFTKLLFTVDEFSDEDHFRDHDPSILGWNLTVATISDILASGGLPRYYGHSVMIDKNKWDDFYLERFSTGIADVLKKTKVFFIGGDVGSSDHWHYTGIALGETNNTVTRIGAKPGDIILMTGQIGAGNLEATLKLYTSKHILNKVLKHYKTRLALRFDESRLISQYATSCIDSSDGVLNALKTLSELNHTGFELTHTPYLHDGVLACKILSKPKELLLMGECGEYELVFT